MKVHLVSHHTIHSFINENQQNRTGFMAWFNRLKHVDWVVPSDILKSYADADLLGKSSKRAIFNIGGNKYRMICKYQFGFKKVHLYVCWIGTHADYDAICKRNLQYTVHRF